MIQPFLTLAELDRTPIEYRIPDLLTTEGNVLISAFRKTGKTSLILNLIAALTSEENFLGSLPCKALPGPVVYVNLELHQSMLWQYCQEMGMQVDNKQVLIQDYRGYSNKYQWPDDEWRSQYTKMLTSVGASALIIDPIHPLLVSGMVDSNSNDEARLALELLGEIARDAELAHLFVIDHTGKADRTTARGASSKEDWADVLWNIGMDADGSSPYRTLTVTGRGVSGEQRYLRRDKHLYLAASHDGSEDRAGHSAGAAGGTQTTQGKILAELRRCPCTVPQLLAAIGTSNSSISAALNMLEGSGNVERVGRARGKGGPDVWKIVQRF